MDPHGAPVADELGEHDASLLDTTLALTPEQRLLRLIAHVRFVEAGRAAMAEARAAAE